jgi:hypothetical protein
MWLANQGYPNLKPTADDDAAAQRVMIKQLASYMGIFREGATASGFKCGVTSYLREAGYAPKSWSVSGGISANGSRTPPDLNLLYTITSRKTLIWLGLGWYRHDPATGKYTRSSGHWVTLAGLDDRAGKDHVARTLIIADPEFPGAHQIITLTAMNVGSLSNGISKADAKGFFLLAKDDTRIENLESRYGVLESIQALTVE